MPKVALQNLARGALGEEAHEVGLVVGRDFKAWEDDDACGLKNLARCVDACHAAVVGQSNDPNAQLLALRQQGLVVRGLREAVVAATISCVVASRVHLKCAAPKACEGKGFAHTRLLAASLSASVK